MLKLNPAMLPRFSLIVSTRKAKFSTLQSKKRAACFLEPVLVSYLLQPLY
jgi:hypothetical protein